MFDPKVYVGYCGLILWVSDCVLYLQDNAIYEHHTLESCVNKNQHLTLNYVGH